MRFIFGSLIIGFAFAFFFVLGEKILLMPILGGTDYTYWEYLQHKELLILILFGPLMLSTMVILSLIFNKNKQDKNLTNINLLFVNKPVIIISLFTVIFSLFAIIYGIGYLASRLLICHYIDTRNYNKTLTLVKISDKIYPQDCMHSEFLAYSNFKKNDKQYKYYEQQALTCNHGNYKTYSAIARYSVKDDKYQDALESLNRGLLINQDSFVLHFNKQYTHFKMKDCENGIKDTENILNIINKKGSESYIYNENGLIIEEQLPDNWKAKILKDLSTCPNSQRKEELIKKLKAK